MEDQWMLSQFPRDFVGYACEVGAYDGSTGSTTLSLQQAGWTTLAIEPNPELEPAIKLWRPIYRMVACGSENLDDQDFFVNLHEVPAGFSALTKTFPHPDWQPLVKEWKTVKVPVRTLDSVLEEVGFPRLDALTIDTEGTELDVLKGLTLSRWRPKVVIIESWAVNSPVIPWMADRGYKQVNRVSVNDFFVRKSDADLYAQRQ